MKRSEWKHFIVLIVQFSKHEIKKYKSIIWRKRKKHNKLVLLAKDKLNNIKSLISKALIDSYNSHYEFIFVSNELKDCDGMKDLKV